MAHTCSRHPPRAQSWHPSRARLWRAQVRGPWSSPLLSNAHSPCTTVCFGASWHRAFVLCRTCWWTRQVGSCRPCHRRHPRHHRLRCRHFPSLARQRRVYPPLPHPRPSPYASVRIRKPWTTASRRLRTRLARPRVGLPPPPIPSLRLPPRALRSAPPQPTQVVVRATRVHRVCVFASTEVNRTLSIPTPPPPPPRPFHSLPPPPLLYAAAARGVASGTPGNCGRPSLSMTARNKGSGAVPSSRCSCDTPSLRSTRVS